MFDGQEDTAWSSDQVIYVKFLQNIPHNYYIMFMKTIQGLPQSIAIAMNDPIDSIDLKQCTLAFKFQGGFVGNVCHLTLENTDGEVIHKISFYPDDINDRQVFPLINQKHNDTDDQLVICKNVAKFKILFEKSTDFFGRIIIYNLEICC